MCRISESGVYKISGDRLRVWLPGNKDWCLSQENIHNFSQCDWSQVEDPSQKWVKCNHNDLWKWVVKQIEKGNRDARFRSLLGDDMPGVNTEWTVGSVLTNAAGPAMVIPHTIKNWEYLDR